MRDIVDIEIRHGDSGSRVQEEWAAATNEIAPNKSDRLSDRGGYGRQYVQS
jgi:hypothetical protein